MEDLDLLDWNATEDDNIRTEQEGMQGKFEQMYKYKLFKGFGLRRNNLNS
jgi:hypothetical protein